MLLLRGAGAALLFVVAAQVLAQGAGDYPNRPVRLIIPIAAGGGPDTIGRAVGMKLTDNLGQTFVVDNRAGATGLIGTQIVAKAAPDGYTLLLADMPHAILPLVYSKKPYDAIRCRMGSGSASIM